MSKARFTWQSALMRTLIGVLGGLVLALSFMVGTTGILTAMQWMARADAVVATGMLAFLAWTMAVLVSFGARSSMRAAAWVLGGGAGFMLVGWGGTFVLHAT
jgi:hypothetical protein